MPTSAPGSSGASTLTSFAAPRGGSAELPAGRPTRCAGRFVGCINPQKRARGFTLLELLVVVALIAIATAVASLALRDPAAARLEQEAARLVALLESARAEARASGLAARWEPLSEQADGSGFRFVGLPATDQLPTRWLDASTAAQVIGARAIVLGPEPLIGEQRILLRLDNQRLVLSTDGIGPFAVAEGGTPPP
jgi:general secretion pathway protein H